MKNQRQQPPKQQQRPPAQQAPKTAPVSSPVTIQEFKIGLPDMFPQVDKSKSYPTIQEFLETVDILKYETYVGELNTQKKDEYWAAEGIDHFASDLGIGVCELIIYDLGDVWLIMAHARCVTDNRPSCAAVTHDKKDRHSLEKAVRRAGRNAIKYMIPLVLLKDMLEKAKAERAVKASEAENIKKASEQAGKIMREHRENFSEITDVPTLLQFVEEKVGRARDDWIVADWNFLSAGVGDANSLFLKELSEYVGQEPQEEDVEEDIEEVESEEESEEEVDFEAIADSIQESE